LYNSWVYDAVFKWAVKVGISKRPPGAVGISRWPPDPGADRINEWPPDPGGVGTCEWTPDLDVVGTFEWAPDPGGYLGA